MMTDPISDMLTRIRNASMARHDRTVMPHSMMKERVAHVLKAEGFIDDVRVADAEEGGQSKVLTIVMRYGRDRISAIDGVRRISTPGRRVYVRHDRIPRVRAGLGISILSTSVGVLTDTDARKQRVGGELICEVW